MKKIVYLYSGEGTKNSESKPTLLKHSKYWPEIDDILSSKLNLNLEEIWQNEIGKHRCPCSPLLTVVSQICLSDIWSQWGYKPDVVIGHSVGELTAAFQAGLYPLEDILVLTYQLGEAAANLNGVMLHGKLSDQQIDRLSVNLSSLNFVDNSKKHVTLSGYTDEMLNFLSKNSDFVKMRLPHPWHHPDYRKFIDEIKIIKSNKIDDSKFVSGVTTNFEYQLKDQHWHNWLATPVDFIRAMQTIKKEYNSYQLEIIEIGFHPVLDKCCDVFDNYTYVSSMFRGEDEIEWILHQRKMLDQKLFLDKLARSIEEFRPGLDFKASLAYQNFTSLTFAEFSEILQIYFPSLAPQDFYRYKTVNQLIKHFGLNKSDEQHVHIKPPKNEVAIAGMSCKFPSSIENLPQFWEMLLSREDQIKADADRGHFEAGFMNDEITRFDHKYFNISEAEARTMDPQQILALELTELLWQDAGIDLAVLDKKRIGVYIGVWNQEYRGDRESVYFPIGTNPSIIASRISYHYDLRGPSWVSNTACSSSLVAVHYASKDIEAGRVDYAIAGGVNMILGNDFTDQMKNSGFLSEDNRCKTFDDSANGYVRSEGGGLVLLANKNLVKNYYADLLGSSINQNGGRSAIISAPNPEAQEELINDACQDAAIQPQDITYLECHGTGTKIGDPIEISAIQRTIANGRKRKCFLGSVKSNIGHLESAAGMAGLIKSVLILYHGIIPPNLHFNRPNQYIDFESYNLKVASEETKIDNQTHIGISSFGFGGTNAHIIIKGVDDKVRKNIENIEIQFDRTRSSVLADYYQLDHLDSNRNGIELDSNLKSKTIAENADDEIHISQDPNNKLSREEVRNLIQGLFFKVTNIESIDPDVELIEQGMDSMSITEFISQLQSSLDIEIDPDLIFEHPLPDQLIDEIHALI
ncbi:Polyketide synthase modules and related proteins [Olavius sp. associated proteobacterium Delta 1]|nr:Polyketide synthase modules and related proteins [Olavius sp. associated proteobacterium Delta 1]